MLHVSAQWLAVLLGQVVMLGRSVGFKRCLPQQKHHHYLHHHKQQSQTEGKDMRVLRSPCSCRNQHAERTGHTEKTRGKYRILLRDACSQYDSLRDCKGPTVHGRGNLVHPRK